MCTNRELQSIDQLKKEVSVTTLGSKGCSAYLFGIARLLATSLVIAGLGHAQSTFNHPGNILITDQFNNRVIEIDKAGNIVWQFGGGPNNITASAIIGTNDAERVGGLTLMAGTGIPPGVAQAAEACFSAGCVDNRVPLVNNAGHFVWQYGQFGVTGCGPNQLNVPVQNTYLSQRNGDDHVLITDQSNERIIEVRRSDKVIVWWFGQDNVSGMGPSHRRATFTFAGTTGTTCSYQKLRSR